MAKFVRHIEAYKTGQTAGAFWTPATNVYACVTCGCDLYHPANAKYPPPEYCYFCKPNRHTFIDDIEDVQPAVLVKSVVSVTRECEICGTNINHLRPQAKTCSRKCRKALSRKLSTSLT